MSQTKMPGPSAQLQIISIKGQDCRNRESRSLIEMIAWRDGPGMMV
jgi:hypothetical protein